MPLTQHDIDELKAIYRAEFGKDLPNDEAWDMGLRLIEFCRVVLRPLPDDEPSDGSVDIQ